MTIIVTNIKGCICDSCQTKFDHKPIRWFPPELTGDGWRGWRLCSEECKAKIIEDVKNKR